MEMPPSEMSRDPSSEPPRFYRPDPEEVKADPAAKNKIVVGGAGTSSNVEVVDYDEAYEAARVPTVSKFRDHFTLPIPTSVVRYRSRKGAARVIEGSDDYQFVLEENYDDEGKMDITIRRIQDSGSGLRFLRATYTIVTAFWAGFLFVISMQILLFLFLDLAIQLGITDDGGSAKWFASLGAIFGILPLIHGLASGMVLAQAFAVDTWNGHMLIRSFTLRGLTEVTLEWLFFTFFLGLPLLVMCITMLTGSDEWWVITGTFWVFSVAAFFIFFVINVISYEMKATFEVIKNQFDDDDDSAWAVFERSLLLRQVATYSGQMHRVYLSRGGLDDAEATDKKAADLLIAETLKESKNWRQMFNQFFVKWGWFEEYSEPHRYFSVEDARDVRPYITSHTWSLEKIFCRPKNSRYVAIIKGSGALTRAQMKSSIFCSIIGTFLILFLILSLLVYLEAGAVATGFLLVIAILSFIPTAKSTYSLYLSAKDIISIRTRGKTEYGADAGTERDLAAVSYEERDSPSFVLKATDSEGLFLAEENYRVTRPSNRTAWVFFYIEFLILFVWPTISLFSVGNWQLGLTYFVIVGASGLRYYFNAAIVLEEVGHMDMVDRGSSERDFWRNQSRLDDIVGKITRSRSKGMWVGIIATFAMIFLALFAGSFDQSTTAEIEDPSYTYLTEFEYKPVENSLRYPTCHLTSDLQESPLTAMADYIFLARVAYRGNITQQELNSWFGDEVAINQEDFVTSFRQANAITSAVHFKMITYPSTNSSAQDFAFVAIRGTTNAWEAMTDAQLWSGAMLIQALREFLPFGSIWTPVAPILINAATSIQSSSIDEISFYKDTTRFTNFLKTGNYSGVAVTGHSLGGGLAMITGAQSKVPSVALSGPNSMMTRKSLDPQVSIEDFDRYTFNIMPERDLVPMIDDPAQNTQQIRCNADFTDAVGCHDTTRALCEAISTCGSNGRPVLCECVTVFKFLEPTPIDPNGITFKEACNITSD